MKDAAERFLIVHGHFYQPPRENPWLDEVEPEPTRGRFRDWNEAIARECYGPNGLARIMDPKNRIIAVVNNYARMSFNFGPTLLKWLERHDPETMAALLEADRLSLAKTGFGNALAHPFNHVILPLASQRDKTTQVRWGIEDFSRRFGRRPLGMWLPETAVDTATLTVLADHGIEFTVLAPRQAARIRPTGKPIWCEVDSATLDTSVPYLQRLPGGRSIAIFFFQGALSHSISFEKGLESAPELMEEIEALFDKRDREGPGLVVLATDGETFGHHFEFGDMGLASLFELADSSGTVRVTNFAQFLAMHPVSWEVEIAEETSWSCGHGIERWRHDCGCRLGGPENHQRWRGPLRRGLDNLAQKIDALYLSTVEHLVADPWSARDDYIGVVLEYSDEARERFVSKVSKKSLSEDERKSLFRALEMARSRLAMFTSCGWFFDEISGLETVLILALAARAVDLAGMLGARLEEGLIRDLAKAPSNKKKYRDGKGVYLKKVARARRAGETLAAAWALRRLLGLDFGSPAFRVEESARTAELPEAAVLGGRVDLSFPRILKRCSYLVLAALPGNPEMVLMVKSFGPGEEIEAAQARVEELIAGPDLEPAVRFFESLARAKRIGLEDLPPGASFGLLGQTDPRLAQKGLAQVMPALRLGPGLLRELEGLSRHAPGWTGTAAGLFLDFRLAEELAALTGGRDPSTCLGLLKLAKDTGHTPDQDLIGDAAIAALEVFIRSPGSASAAALQAVFDAIRALAQGPDLWPHQNLFFRNHLAESRARPGKKERSVLLKIGEFLGFTKEILAGLG